MEREATSSQTGNSPSPMAEALAVEAHQVDRRKVGLARDAASAQLLDRRVTVHARAGAAR